MKATQRNFAQTAAGAARKAKIFFFCGPDEAGAHGAAARVIAMLDDPGEKVEIDGGDLKRDPVRLADETRSTSLFGDRRHIVVRANGEEALEALKILTDSDPAEIAQGWPVLIVANGATDKSRSAKLLEKRDDALVAMFYPPDLASVTGEVRRLADAAGLRMGTELAQRIAGSVGLDTRMAASEVAKLALYLDADPQAPRNVTAQDLDAIAAETEDDGMMPLVDAVLSGDAAKVPHELSRFHQLNLNPVGTVLAMERRVAQLAQLAARMGQSGDVAGFVAGEVQSRRLFFRDQPAVTQQLQRWRGPRLARLGEKLIELHRALLADSQAAPLLFAAGCAEIARAAQPRR
ncbi:DNA polymerase III subunit delta [Croceicoccus naphthovorans]|uniref:DNA-directed DNA polymerase n=1 Tax=Croceicoccus naphthovorans TaxID=1348774 RepID=A0A0G3XL06_9SPHN|nr:DNA polymerase III subunit delta [Croceicoccus naphthovorans]AKM11286.1 DNA polymerase III subunit delta [Croceicoccus naphthovorans]MBB3989793.1 DNA polymerase-3 subunit delta [Croceicoccus naphthovorans]